MTPDISKSGEGRGLALDLLLMFAAFYGIAAFATLEIDFRHWDAFTRAMVMFGAVWGTAMLRAFR